MLLLYFTTGTGTFRGNNIENFKYFSITFDDSGCNSSNIIITNNNVIVDAHVSKPNLNSVVFLLYFIIRYLLKVLFRIVLTCQKCRKKTMLCSTARNDGNLFARTRQKLNARFVSRAVRPTW